MGTNFEESDASNPFASPQSPPDSAPPVAIIHIERKGSFAKIRQGLLCTIASVFCFAAAIVVLAVDVTQSDSLDQSVLGVFSNEGDLSCKQVFFLGFLLLAGGVLSAAGSAMCMYGPKEIGGQILLGFSLSPAVLIPQFEYFQFLPVGVLIPITILSFIVAHFCFLEYIKKLGRFYKTDNLRLLLVMSRALYAVVSVLITAAIYSAEFNWQLSTVHLSAILILIPVWQLAYVKLLFDARRLIPRDAP